MRTGATPAKLKLTNIFGKACAASGLAALLLGVVALGQAAEIIPGGRYSDSYSRLVPQDSYTQTYDDSSYRYGTIRATGWRDELGDSEVSPVEGLASFGFSMVAGVAGIAAGRSRRRQLIDHNYAVNVATGKPDVPEEEEGRMFGRSSRGAGHTPSLSEYRRMNDYDSGFWNGFWLGNMSSGGGSYSGGGGGSWSGGSGSSSSKSNDKNAGQAMAVLALIVAAAAATWITYKSVKLNFFSEPLVGADQTSEKPALSL